jgi:hypothetical protein
MSAWTISVTFAPRSLSPRVRLGASQAQLLAAELHEVDVLSEMEAHAADLARAVMVPEPWPSPARWAHRAKRAVPVVVRREKHDRVRVL